MRSSIVGLLLCVLVRAAGAECVPHTPYIQVAEQVQLADPGETVTNEVTFRNTDSCECAESCFQVTSGYHPPNGHPEPADGIRIKRTRLLKPNGNSLGGSVCLEPGEEQKAILVIAVAEEQDGPGYITPVVFARRSSELCYTTASDGTIAWAPGCFEREGGALCVGMDYFECRRFVYPAGPGDRD